MNILTWPVDQTFSCSSQCGQKCLRNVFRATRMFIALVPGNTRLLDHKVLLALLLAHSHTLRFQGTLCVSFVTLSQGLSAKIPSSLDLLFSCWRSSVAASCSIVESFRPQPYRDMIVTSWPLKSNLVCNVFFWRHTLFRFLKHMVFTCLYWVLSFRSCSPKSTKWYHMYKLINWHSWATGVGLYLPEQSHDNVKRFYMNIESMNINSQHFVSYLVASRQRQAPAPEC